MGCVGATGFVWGFLVFALDVSPLIVEMMQTVVTLLPGGPHGLGLVLAGGLVLLLLAVFGGNATVEPPQAPVGRPAAAGCTGLSPRQKKQ